MSKSYWIMEFKKEGGGKAETPYAAVISLGVGDDGHNRVLVIGIVKRASFTTYRWEFKSHKSEGGPGLWQCPHLFPDADRCLASLKRNLAKQDWVEAPAPDDFPEGGPVYSEGQIVRH